MNRRYFEDLAVGQRYHSTSPVAVTAERIKAFAAEFDPQPFHLDEAAARDTFFAGLAASGWHTAAITMRLLVESDLRPAGGTIGAGGEELPKATSGAKRQTRPFDGVSPDARRFRPVPRRFHARWRAFLR